MLLIVLVNYVDKAVPLHYVEHVVRVFVSLLDNNLFGAHEAGSKL